MTVVEELRPDQRLERNRQDVDCILRTPTFLKFLVTNYVSLHALPLLDLRPWCSRQ